MTLIADMADFLPHTITIEPYSGQDKYGDPSFGSPVSYKGRVELKNRMVRDNVGQERVSRGKIFLNTQTIPSAKDRITLPSGYEPTNPEILAIHPKENETGIDHIVIMMG